MTLGDFGDKSFAMRMLNMGWEKCFGAYSRYFSSASPKEIAYFYAFVSEGCIGLLRRWLREGMTDVYKRQGQFFQRLHQGISSPR